MLPHLRAFGRSLTGNADLADDLVQETMLKAWKARASYIPGPSSMKSWAFVILRNCFLSQMRRKKFTADYDELAAERLLVAPDDQDDSLHLSDVQRALMMLPVDQREALILIGAGQLSYEEGADICGVAVGTMKSRVSRPGRLAGDPRWRRDAAAQRRPAAAERSLRDDHGQRRSTDKRGPSPD